MVARRTYFNAVVWGNAVHAGAEPGRKGNGTQVLTHPDTRWTPRLANIQFTQRKASRILQRTTLSLFWNRPLSPVHRIPFPTSITAGRGRNEVGCPDEAPSSYFAEQ